MHAYHTNRTLRRVIADDAVDLANVETFFADRCGDQDVEFSGLEAPDSLGQGLFSQRA